VTGAIVAVPGLRFRGVYLLLATLALLYVVQFAGERLQQGNTNYLAGISMNPGPGSSLMNPGRAASVTAAVVLVIGLIIIERLYRTQAGREWASVKENEIASAAMGIRVQRRKIQAFVGSSVVTAVAGGLFAYYIGLVAYTAFDLNLTLQLVVMVFVGGAAAAIGPVIGAAIVTLLPYLLNDTVGHLAPSGWYQQNGPFLEQIIYGLALAFILLYARSGLAGLRTVALRLVRRPGPAPEPIPEATPEAALEAAPATPPRTALLTVSSLSVRYAGAGVAVQDVSLDVADGVILGILGRNGAGKSTLLKSIGGFPPGDRVRLTGHARIGEVELTGHSPEYCTRRGVVLVPEQGKVFPALTVREHFALAGARGRTAVETLRQAGLTMLERRLDNYAASLSGGERQFLALGVAVLRQPKLLLVDEMSLGLAPIAVAEVGQAILRIREATGCAVILVEQNAQVAASIADELAVLEHGRVMWRGLPRDLPADALETAYFGQVRGEGS
jgi:branched-chain amino acid transport system ATP-binding protein